MEGAPQRRNGELDARPRGRRTHLCSACDFPISVYGRLAPCQHAFCLTCAANMSRCIICGAAVTKLERITREAGLYISPLTLQGFRSERDLAAHTAQAAAKLSGLLAAAEGGARAPGGGMMGGGGMHAPPMVHRGGMGMAAHGGMMGMPGSGLAMGVPGAEAMAAMAGIMLPPGMTAVPAGMYAAYVQPPGMMRPPGWKPPPPPGAPPPAARGGPRQR